MGIFVKDPDREIKEYYEKLHGGVCASNSSSVNYDKWTLIEEKLKGLVQMIFGCEQAMRVFSKQLEMVKQRVKNLEDEDTNMSSTTYT